MVNRLDRITINPEQCGGRPCLRGLRIRVSDVLSYRAAGDSYEDILAAIAYAAAQTGHAVVRVA